MLSDGVQQLEKTTTDYDKCRNQERTYHTQVDAYEGALGTYEARAATVRRTADEFLAAREAFDRLNGEFEALDKKVWDLFFGKSDGSSDYEYREATDARDRAEQPALDAASARDRARSVPGAELRSLERLRLRALHEMRRALRLQSAMYQCEFTCSVEELDLDKPADSLPTPATGTLDPSHIPVPENFIGIVAKCAKCQPLAEMANTIRSHRRAFASTAQSVYESLTHNRETLDRLEHEARALELEERALYRNLLRSFTAQGPGENADRIDQVFDAADQHEAAKSLRQIAERRAKNARLRISLAKTIATRLQRVLEAIANYRVHTVLLKAAEQRLAACEQTCKPADSGRVGLNDPFIDRACPVPENFGPIVADCPECQPATDALAQAKSERRRVASEIQDVVWLLKSRRAGLERMEARSDVLGSEERDIAEQLVSGGEGVDDDALVDRLFEIEAEQTRLTSDMLWAEDEIRRMEPQLEALLKAHEELTWRVEDLQAELQVCNFNCPDGGGGTATAIPGSVFDPSLPQPELLRYVTTDCPSCQPMADALNALLLERYTVAADIQSTAARIASHEAARAGLDAKMASLLAREQELVPVSTGTGDATAKEAATRELPQIDAKRQRLDAEIDAAAEVLRDADSDLAAKRAYYDQVDRGIPEARARLGACEKNCADTGDGTTGLTGQDDFVRTDCAPCETLASLLNDVIGSIATTEKTLAEVQTALEALRSDIAAAQAAKTAAQDAFATALVEKSRLEAADQDGSGQQVIADEQNKRASDLLSDLEDFEFEERDVAERAEELSSMLAQLRQRETSLRNDLAECEKQCGGPGPAAGVDAGEETAPGVDPDFILDKLQPEKCQGGSDCTFEIGATNAGAATYRGPLFLRESGSVAAGGNGAPFGDWHCSPAANGQSICLTTTEVASGQTITLRVPIRLPGHVSPGAENCVDVIVAVDTRLLVQLVQVGLAARGLDPGVADGWPGPRTNAAITAFGEQAGLELDPADLASIYAALFGTQPPGGPRAAGHSCVKMDVENPSRATPAPNTTAPNTTPPAQQTQPQPQPQPEETTPRGNFSIGIGIGIGGREGEREGGRGRDGPRIEFPFPNLFGN